MTYLGHVFSGAGMSPARVWSNLGQVWTPDPTEVNAMKNWPITQSVKQFLGLASYYRQSNRQPCKHCCTTISHRKECHSPETSNTTKPFSILVYPQFGHTEGTLATMPVLWSYTVHAVLNESMYMYCTFQWHSLGTTL